MKKIGKFSVNYYSPNSKNSEIVPKEDKQSIWSVMGSKKLLVLLFLMVAVGVVCGSCIAKNADEMLINKMDFIFFGSYSLRKSYTWVELFSSSLMSSVLYIIPTILMGASLWGAVTIPILNFLKGFGLGITMGYLFLTMGANGVFFALVIVLPGAFLSTIALVYCSEKAISYAVGLVRAIGIKKGGKDTPINLSPKAYLIQSSRSFAIVLVATVVDTIISGIFVSFF